MVLSDFTFLTDENIHPDLVKFLRSKSFSVKDVREEKLHGTSDENLLNLSFKENRVILTQDRDFGRLIYTKSSDFIGIVFLRPGHILPDFHIQTIKYLLVNNLDLLKPFILVAENSGKSIKVRLKNNIVIS